MAPLNLFASLSPTNRGDPNNPHDGTITLSARDGSGWVLEIHVTEWRRIDLGHVTALARISVPGAPNPQSDAELAALLERSASTLRSG